MPGPAKNHLQIKSSQKCARPSAKEENLFSNKCLAGKGGGEPRVTKGARGPGLFGLPGRRGSGRAQLTTGTDRLISTWSCRNPIRGLRSVGQPRHVNLFSMCAARRSQTTGAQEARPQPCCSGGVNKELKASKCSEVAAARSRPRPAGPEEAEAACCPPPAPRGALGSARPGGRASAGTADAGRTAAARAGRRDPRAPGARASRPGGRGRRGKPLLCSRAVGESRGAGRSPFRTFLTNQNIC